MVLLFKVYLTFCRHKDLAGLGEIGEILHLLMTYRFNKQYVMYKHLMYFKTLEAKK